MDGWDVESAATMITRRRDLLRSIRDEPTTKRRLVETHDVSRSTVDRAVRELESAGFVDRREGTVRATLGGRLAIDAYEGFADVLVGLDEAAPVLDGFPADTTLGIDFLRGVTAIESQSHAPHRPISALADVLAEASAVRTYATMVVPDLVTTYHEQIVESDCTVELVANRAVMDALVAEYPELLDEGLRSGNVDLYETERDEPSYSLLVADGLEAGRVGATLHGDRGVTGVLRNGRSDAVEWLLGLYESIREDARSIA